MEGMLFLDSLPVLVWSPFSFCAGRNEKETKEKKHIIKENRKQYYIMRIPGVLLYSGCLVLSMVQTVASPVGAEAVGLQCAEVAYLEAGREGMISCALESFYSVSWYTKKDYDDLGSPYVYFNGEKHGQLEEYDVLRNGSFVIKNVSLSHAGSYIVEMLQDLLSEPIPMEVYVHVYVISNPPYPVVDGHSYQQHVYKDVNRNGELSCSMRRVYPNISLAWTVVDPSHSNTIHFHDAVVGRTQNEDQTYDITLTSLYQVTDYSIPRITIQCGVADEIGEVLAEKTLVDLLFLAVYPVVNGHINQKHVYLDVKRQGYLTCVKENVESGTDLIWEVTDPSMQNKVTLGSNPVVSNNNDGTRNINQTLQYEAHDNSLERITIECRVIRPDSNERPLTTKVDLLFENVYPVVNGHINQKHVYLDVKRQGYLTCVKENVESGTDLIWELVNPSMQNKVTLGSNPVVSNNNDGTRNINQTLQYEAHDNSLERITIECRVIEPDSNEHPLTTKVDLLFENVYPVVNGHVGQKHVYLDVERKGHLTCMKENVDAGTTLVWQLVDASIQGKISFSSSQALSNNSRGSMTINQMFDYEVHDRSLERITVECTIIKSDTDELPITTRVDLLFENVYPVVNGYVNQKHVYLDVEREGHLTCVKENVDAGTRLFWALDPAIRGKVNFQSISGMSINDDGTVNINQTFEYAVHDNSLERITVECKLLEPDSDEHPYTTAVDLLFPSDPVISGCYHQLHDCILEVERQGELTCTVRNSQHPLYLEWTTKHGDVNYFKFGNATVEHRNNTNLYDVSITTQYTLLDESVTILMVQCNAYRFESGPVLSVAYASLNIQSGGEYGDKYITVISHDHKCVNVISFMIVLMLITILLMVSIHLLLTMKLNKMTQIMAQKLLEGCRLNGRDLIIPEDTHSVKSVTPDSGNSGSNSRDGSESESSAEELSLMAGSSTYNTKQQVSLEDKGHSEETPMVKLKTFEEC